MKAISVSVIYRLDTLAIPTPTVGDHNTYLPTQLALTQAMTLTVRQTLRLDYAQTLRLRQGMMIDDYDMGQFLDTRQVGNDHKKVKKYALQN